MTLNYKSSIGSYFPTGATVSDAGVNFSIFSRHASAAELVLYEAAGSPEPFQVISLNHKTNRSFFFWHVFVEGLPAGTHYTWRTYGPTDTAATGRCFNPKMELVDPWAKAVTDVFWNRRRASDTNDESRSSYRGVAVKSDYLWATERSCKRGLEGAVIYELHVGGFTRHPSSDVGHPGTFAGLIDKISYLQELGITHVELLPVMAFDELFVPDNVAARGLKNYWGYNTHSFFSPHPGYCVPPELGTHAREFKELIALRRRHPNLNRREYLSGKNVAGRSLRDIAWHGYRLDEPLWFDYGAQFLAYTLADLADDEEDLHVILNMSERTVEAPLPVVSGRIWHLALDTSNSGSNDIMPRDRQKAFEGSTYPITRRTVAVFEARG